MLHLVCVCEFVWVAVTRSLLLLNMHCERERVKAPESSRPAPLTELNSTKERDAHHSHTNPLHYMNFHLFSLLFPTEVPVSFFFWGGGLTCDVMCVAKV